MKRVTKKIRKTRTPVTKAMLADEVRSFENLFNCSLNVIKEEDTDYQLYVGNEMVMTGTRKEIVQFLRHYMVMNDHLQMFRDDR